MLPHWPCYRDILHCKITIFSPARKHPLLFKTKLTACVLVHSKRKKVIPCARNILFSNELMTCQLDTVNQQYCRCCCCCSDLLLLHHFDSDFVSLRRKMKNFSEKNIYSGCLEMKGKNEECVSWMCLRCVCEKKKFRRNWGFKVAQLFSNPCFVLFALFFVLFRFVFFYFFYVCVRRWVVLFFSYVAVVLFFLNKLTFGFTSCFTFRS